MSVWFLEERPWYLAACAGDIGMAVKSIELLALAAEIFETIERLTRLHAETC